ncbi:hypothetical protein CEK00_09410 [Stenotrophomonas maltophilia]|uniref:Transposase DDE domain-containing protein n=1 Tax=Stenotrophomonas maltophilia TaxID=40324 RepID=A0A270NJ80_STEMA|nr:hypothetical protein CEK00_21730 [Stenotrophomonas maltophilia]PAM71800.1 hypothetical protein CEK00_09410 [Stenotrophomonas maltophilia]
MERWERWKAGMRAKVDHPFWVIKHPFGYTKAHYHGLAKNTAQVLTLFALANLWMASRQLLPAQGLIRSQVRTGTTETAKTEQLARLQFVGRDELGDSGLSADCSDQPQIGKLTREDLRRVRGDRTDNSPLATKGD